MGVRMGMRKTLATILLVAVSIMAFAGSALAADTTVWGAQTYLSEDNAKSDTSMNLVFISGDKGSTLYFNVKDGSTPLAQYLPHTLGENADEGDTAADVFSIDIAGGLDEAKLKDGSYTVEAWTKRKGDQLYGGTVYGVWAKLSAGDGSDGTQLIGTRTVSDSDSFDFIPPSTIYRKGKAYKLANDTPDIQNKLAYYSYEPYNPEKSVDGQINYVDQDGSLLKVETFPVSTDGSKVTHEIPDAFDADNGRRYRTLAFTDSVTAVYPTQTSFTVQCLYMRGSSYLAKIQMVDDEGDVIATDTVNVDDKYNYVAPQTIYKQQPKKGETRVVSYALTDDEVWPLDATADMPYVVNGTRTITINYLEQALESGEVAVTYNQHFASPNSTVSGRLLGTQTVTVTKDNPEAKPDMSIDNEGTTYEIVGNLDNYAYTYGSGKIPVIDVYYAPDSNGAPEDYDVTVNYVNYATGEVVRSESFTSTMGDEVVDITSPSTFDQGGNTYIRLAGQDGGLTHNHYSGIDTYTVYYRDSNDALSKNAVIERTRVVVREVADGTTGTDANGTPAAGTAADVPTAVSLNPGVGYNVVGGAGNNTMVNNRGHDSNTERIADDKTPLADDGSATTPTDEGGFVAGGVAAAVAALIALMAALIWWFLVGRRRNEEDEA